MKIGWNKLVKMRLIKIKYPHPQSFYSNWLQWYSWQIMILAFPVSHCNKVVLFRILHPLAIWDFIETALGRCFLIASFPAASGFTTAMVSILMGWFWATSTDLLWPIQESFNNAAFRFECTTTIKSWIIK